MSRIWQYFEAPGEEGEPLEPAPSPWTTGRIVRIPDEHWTLIQRFAHTIDERLASELESVSHGNPDNLSDEVDVSFERLARLASFMQLVAAEVRLADPLILTATDDVPDALTNDEHASMLKSVAAVLSESVRLGQPFRAWVD